MLICLRNWWKDLITSKVSSLYLLWKLRSWKGYKWDKVFKNGLSKICGRQPLKNFNWSTLEYFVPYISFPSRPLLQSVSNPEYNIFFKGCLLQILLGLFLNTLFQIPLNNKTKCMKVHDQLIKKIWSVGKHCINSVQQCS